MRSIQTFPFGGRGIGSSPIEVTHLLRDEKTDVPRVQTVPRSLLIRSDLSTAR